MAETVLKPPGGPSEVPAKANPAPGRLLRAAGICKSYRGNGSHLEVLRNLDFELNVAETVAVVGASGIGKSTLLHILGTLDRPERGASFTATKTCSATMTCAWRASGTRRSGLSLSFIIFCRNSALLKT